MVDSINDIGGMGYQPFSEKRIVKALIENRSKIDSSYYALRCESDIYTSSGTPRFSEDILLTYVSLDKLIAECGLSEREQLIVNEQMYGYGISDIADHFGLQKSTCSTLFARAVDKIVAWHNEVLFYTQNHNIGRKLKS